MNAFDYLRPASLQDALALAEPQDGRVWLAGGQSLIAAMKLGMAAPPVLIDLQDVPELREIRVEQWQGQECLWIGAMVTHAGVARSELVRRHAPGLCELAGGIADAQVREMGTMGGSLAHNDPAACWPTGVLAMGATVVTSRREIAAGDYFQGLYTTALAAGDLILGVRFPMARGLCYLKFEQPASRFAMVGVAVADLGAFVCVAITGLGMGVLRWPQAEQLLAGQRSVHALDSLSTDDLQALGDVHASADYRRHLAAVLLRRAVARLTGEALTAPEPLAPRSQARQAAARSAPAEQPADGFGGVQSLSAKPEQVWQTLLDPRHLQTCIPGCEALVQHTAELYEATVKVGLGPLSVRFKSEVRLHDLTPPRSLKMVFSGQAGALGSGEGTAQVRLEPVDGGTHLHWWVRVQLNGRLAQFGNRLVEATARQLSTEFFERLALGWPAGEGAGTSRQPLPWWRWLLQMLFSARK